MSGSTARLPTWYVSSSHGRRIVTPNGDQQWRPYGIEHAREVGSSRTACGVGALGWELFWDMPFPPGAGPICEACLAEVVRRVVTRDPTERDYEPSASGSPPVAVRTVVGMSNSKDESVGVS
jgi:hypothetical protein